MTESSDEWRRLFGDAHARIKKAEARAAKAEAERDEWIDSFDLMRAESDVRGAQLTRETARTEEVEAALAEMRERMGNLKPAGMQYRANGPHVHGVTEGNVRDYFANQWVEGYWPEGRQLYAGPWQRIEELRDDDAPCTVSERAADEQGDGEGDRDD